MRHPVLLLSCALALVACPEKPPPADAGPTEPVADAAAAVVEVPKDLVLAVRYENLDGGWAEIPFTPEARPLIDPAQRLEVRTNLELSNYRVRLFDEVDRALESDDEADTTHESLVYRIQLKAPLKTGHRYSLSVDAQTGSAITDATGRTHPDQRLEFQVSGEKEKPAPPPKKPVKKKRRK